MKRFVLALSGLLFLCLCGCQTSNFTAAVPTVTVAIVPTSQTYLDSVSGQTKAYTATLNGVTGAYVTWSIYCSLVAGLPVPAGSTACGTISSTGNSATYTAPTSGITTTTGSVTVTVEASYVNGQNVITASAPVIVEPPLAVTTTTLPNGEVGEAYGAPALAASGGTTPYTWTLASGSALPAGLTLTTAGLITGTPTAAGTKSFTVTATDSSGAAGPAFGTATQTLSITIISPPLITTTLMSNGYIGTAYSATIAASGGVTPYTYTLTGALPAGLSLSSAGVISGTPTMLGTLNFTVNLKDSSATPQTATKALSLAINGASGGALTINTTTLPTAAVLIPYGGTIQVSGGTPPYTWSLASGSSLPLNLILSSSTGAISGAPAAAGTSNFTVMVKDSSATPLTATQALSIKVNAVAACTDSGTNALLTGQYAFSLRGYNSTGPLALVGSFTADGSGHITAGEVDTNGVLGVQQASIITSASSYSVGSDQLGCATIATPFYTFTTRVAVGTLSSSVATEGRILEWETGASAFIATGHILQQTAPTAGLSGSYAFARIGVDSSNGRLAAAGTITASSGSITAGELDTNDVGILTTNVGATGAYTSPDSFGRVTGSVAWTGGSTVTHTLYLASGSSYLYLTTTPVTTAGVQTGEGKIQVGTLGASSVTGNMVLYTTGLNTIASAGDVQLGLLSGDGVGTVGGTIYSDNGGVAQTPVTPSCAFVVAANGRMTLSGAGCGTNPPLFYLWNTNTAWALGQDSGVQAGEVDPQVGTTFTISGTYYSGDADLAAVSVISAEQVGVGVLTQGSTSFTLLSDYTSTTVANSDQTATGTAFGTVSSNGTFITATAGPIDGIVISSTKFAVIDDVTGAYPIVEVYKQ